MRIFKKLFIIICILGVASVGYIALDGFVNMNSTGDVAVVLGNKVLDTGEPSPRLVRRLDAAVELFQDGEVKHILVSGGLDSRGNNEAQVMKDYLVAAGVPGIDISLDEQGINTGATAMNTKTFLGDTAYDSVIVVSHFYHLTRTKIAIKQVGVNVVGEKHARYEFDPRDFYSLGREMPAIIKYLLVN